MKFEYIAKVPYYYNKMFLMPWSLLHAKARPCIRATQELFFFLAKLSGMWLCPLRFYVTVTGGFMFISWKLRSLSDCYGGSTCLLWPTLLRVCKSPDNGLIRDRFT